jgi:hypothetical protein
MKKIECRSGKKLSRNIYNILFGILMIFISLFLFVTFTIWIVISKTLHLESENIIVRFLQSDKHYCLAIPIIIPISFIFLYLKWTALNYFKYS